MLIDEAVTVDEILEELAKGRGPLPADAMRAALAHWDEIAPAFLRMLDAWVDGTDRSERAGNVLFIALHLMAEARETRAFAPLCALAQDNDAVEGALGKPRGRRFPAS
jgi:hypothetical protein